MEVKPKNFDQAGINRAIATMRTASDVYDWNRKRRQLQRTMSLRDWVERGYCSAIDCSGLIVKTLGHLRTAGNVPVHQPFEYTPIEN